MKGLRSSTSSTIVSHANFPPWSSFGPSQAELAAAQAETQQYQQRLDVMEYSMRSMTQFIVELQS